MPHAADNSPSPDPATVRAEAVAWVWRLDRGLSAPEQDAFFQWLAAHPAHAEELRRCRAHWARVNRLAEWRPEHGARPNADLLAPSTPAPWRRRLRPFALALAASLALGAALFLWRAPAPSTPAAPPPLAQEDRRILPDRSAARLNAGAQLALAYSPTERRVRLEQGEAFFTVVPDPARPFIVEAGGVEVRALGTAFNVRVEPAHVAVIVTHGSVALAPPTLHSGPPTLAVLTANQQLHLPRHAPAPAPDVTPIDRAEILRRLAWQHGLMTFRDEPLAAIVTELNRINPTRIVLHDAALGASRFSGTIRSDNVAGFVRLLETAFGAEIVARADDEILLRTKSPP